MKKEDPVLQSAGQATEEAIAYKLVEEEGERRTEYWSSVRLFFFFLEIYLLCSLILNFGRND